MSADESARAIVSKRVIAASREAIWDAIRDPQRLARWWGPAGFRNTFETFEFRPGGPWKFVMHGPDGTDYQNESVFTSIDAPSGLVLEHHSAPRFTMTISLEARGDRTEFGFRQLFESAQVRDQVARYAIPCNEEVFDRLEAELTRSTKEPTMSRQLYVNLPIRDMERTKAFFTSLGFSFNPQFTNDKGACMVIGEGSCVMLLVEPFFQSFTKKPVADATKSTEAILCLSCASRAEVDDLVRKAVAGGATTPNAPQDHGFMYGHGFADLDGHLWELVYMDPAAAPPQA